MLDAAVATSREVVPVSRATRTTAGPRRHPDRTGPRHGPPIDKYDLLLAAVPLAFLAALLASVALDLSIRHALLLATVPGAAAIVHGVFVDPPAPPS